MSELKIYFWVPEKVLFENAGDCLDKFPDLGAAALVVSHVAFEKQQRTLDQLSKYVKEFGEDLLMNAKLQRENQILREACQKIITTLSPRYSQVNVASEALKAADAVRDGE